MLDERKEEAFCTILREELQLATGCTEPIAIALAAAKARQALGAEPEACRGRGPAVFWRRSAATS